MNETIAVILAAGFAAGCFAIGIGIEAGLDRMGWRIATGLRQRDGKGEKPPEGFTEGPT